MEKTEYVNLSTAKDKKIYNPSTKIEISFSDLWTSLEKDQLVYVTFFRRWG